MKPAARTMFKSSSNPKTSTVSGEKRHAPSKIVEFTIVPSNQPSQPVTVTIDADPNDRPRKIIRLDSKQPEQPTNFIKKRFDTVEDYMLKSEEASAQEDEGFEVIKKEEVIQPPVVPVSVPSVPIPVASGSKTPVTQPVNANPKGNIYTNFEIRNELADASGTLVQLVANNPEAEIAAIVATGGNFGIGPYASTLDSRKHASTLVKNIPASGCQASILQLVSSDPNQPDTGRTLPGWIVRSGPADGLSVDQPHIKTSDEFIPATGSQESIVPDNHQPAFHDDETEMNIDENGDGSISFGSVSNVSGAAWRCDAFERAYNHSPKPSTNSDNLVVEASDLTIVGQPEPEQTKEENTKPSSEETDKFSNVPQWITKTVFEGMPTNQKKRQQEAYSSFKDNTYEQLCDCVEFMKDMLPKLENKTFVSTRLYKRIRELADAMEQVGQALDNVEEAFEDSYEDDLANILTSLASLVVSNKDKPVVTEHKTEEKVVSPTRSVCQSPMPALIPIDLPELEEISPAMVKKAASETEIEPVPIQYSPQRKTVYGPWYVSQDSVNAFQNYGNAFVDGDEISSFIPSNIGSVRLGSAQNTGFELRHPEKQQALKDNLVIPPQVTMEDYKKALNTAAQLRPVSDSCRGKRENIVLPPLITNVKKQQ